MTASWVTIVILALLPVGAAASVRILKQYERGVQFRLGRVFPAPLMSTIQELGAFLARETTAANAQTRDRSAPASSTTDPQIHTNGAPTAA